MVRVQARADAGAGRENTTVHEQRLLQSGHERGGALLDFFARSDVLDQYGEFIAAQAREEAASAGGGRAAARSIACSTRSPKLWPSVSLIDLKLSRSTNRSATPLFARRRARESRGQPRRELAAVRQLRQWIMVREMVQLLGALGHMPFELSLMSAQLRFGPCDLICHGVEGFGQFIDLGRAAARCARAAIAGRKLARGRGQPPHRNSDAQGQEQRHEQQHADHGDAGGRQRVLGELRGGRRARRGAQEAAARRFLQMAARGSRQRRACLDEAPARGDVHGVELGDGAAQPHALAEVLAHKLEPCAAR